ncbi:MAG TPA: TCP-1/cpn60 chaperonin family protein, partial [Actinomycetota bacterium]|nr:TCP-1/cpn60 chaperonin family protein [Actinomycetota bacterium]
NGDERSGAEIVRRALELPAQWIARNAGYEGAVVVARIRELSDNQGFDATTGEYVDLVKAGVIDPAKVTRSAVQNAASIAALLLTTETLVVDKPEEKDEAVGAGHGHGGGYPGM